MSNFYYLAYLLSVCMAAITKSTNETSTKIVAATRIILNLIKEFGSSANVSAEAVGSLFKAKKNNEIPRTNDPLAEIILLRINLL